MKKTIALLVCILCVATLVSAQKTNDYDKAAAEIKTEIWGTKDPDFEGNEVPEQYKNESAIILARKYDINAKFKRHIISWMGSGKAIIFQYTLRQKVLIQDKSALEDFSEIGYNKVNKSSYGMGFVHLTDELSTYIGAKVYKKDGTVKEVMLSEAVIVKEDKNKKVEKLAIPDLQVGDILDYYIVSLEKKEMSIIEPMQFLLTGEYPIVKLSLTGDISKKYSVEYRCLNGVPDLKITKDEDGDMQFALKMTNLDKFPFSQWISPMRQARLVKLKISLCIMHSNCKAGEIIKGITQEEIYKKQKGLLENVATAYRVGYLNQQKNFVKESVKALKKRLGKEPPIDSLISTIYNTLRYYSYYETVSNNKIYPGKQRNESSVQSNYFDALLSMFLKDFDVDNDIVFYSSRYMSNLEDLMSDDQPVYMVHTKGAKDYYLTDDGIFSQCGMVPGYAEGEKGVTLEYESLKSLAKSKNKRIDQGSAKIPISKAGDNKSLESLQIVFSLTSSPTATVERQTTSTGLMKEAGQKNLMLFEDYYRDAWKEQGEEKTFIQEFADSKKTKSLAEEWQNSFAKARETYKDAFMQDLKTEYSLEPKELISYKIDKSGVKLAEPAFQYTTKFVMQDWVKKAGNNYLFEVGKTIGSQLRIKEEDRKRTIDIYEPHARAFEYQISVTIPAGYSVEGVDALNKNIENECGLFTCKATVRGDQLLVAVKKEYAHNFEPVANWGKMLAFIDAATDFGNAKVLLKRK